MTETKTYMQKGVEKWVREHKEEILEHINRQKRYSNDIHRQVGVVVYDTSLRETGYGHNRLIGKKTKARLQKPTKYPYMIHAETMAILNSKCHPYLVAMEWFPCANCTKTMIWKGVSHLVCNKLDNTASRQQRYKFLQSLRMLKESRINIIYWEDL